MKKRSGFQVFQEIEFFYVTDMLSDVICHTKPTIIRKWPFDYWKNWLHEFVSA